MTIDPGPDPGAVPLSMADLRVVTGYAAGCAEQVIAVFEDDHAGDRRPRAALEAARAFAGGERRSQVQRVAAFDAHRAAKEAQTEAGRAAARAAGDAAASAYLHPLAQATQVRHILGAAAHAAYAAELAAGGDPATAARLVDRACRSATPALIEVLRRYPPAPGGGGRVGQLMRQLDEQLRRRGHDEPGGEQR